ncbi:MAG: hypothetical protein KA393_06510 [Limnohabitans sp.]|nr:hypothetical protein [Limnohabitans sp.]
MAGSSESNDASDIFWPGYVDAISNLAINLLFVIAVMCIVILSFVLEETTKGKPQEGDAPQVSQSTSEKASKASAAAMQALQTENAKLKQELQAMQQSASSSASGSPSRSNVANTTPKMDVVNARQEVMKDEKGQSSMSTVGAGLIVNFDPKVVTLSPEESKDVMTRLEAYGPAKTTRWQITVISPKGFSESARLGYYRAVAVRNVLIQNGVPGELINMRVVESAQAAADSARVTVNPAP